MRVAALPVLGKALLALTKRSNRPAHTTIVARFWGISVMTEGIGLKHGLESRVHIYQLCLREYSVQQIDLEKFIFVELFLKLGTM